MKAQTWNDKISHTLQWGGIETSILDDGLGKGTRVAWINTGSGLRYKVVIDRALDIAEAFFQQHCLAFISHSGVTSPEPFSDKGLDWLRTFGGGLVTTCGLSHVGPPEGDGDDHHGLHGLVSNIPARIESVIQPDPRNGRLEMSITGVIRETKMFGPSFELRRTISSTLGQPVITISDEVTNIANRPFPHMLLYHCNFGWPLVDEGAKVLWKGDWKTAGRKQDEAIFSDKWDFRTCPAPIKEHNGGGEAVAIIDPKADGAGKVVCGIYNPELRIALALYFDKSQLPCLTNWQHWGANEYVTGLEPGTHPPIGQSAARKNKTLKDMAPGEKKKYDITFRIFHEEHDINSLLKNFDQ